MLRQRIASMFIVLVVLLAGSAAQAGPPWISLEYPSNPFHDDTRGALMLVHTFHHGHAMNFPLSGTLEGIVNGKRQSLPLQITRTYRPGVYAVRGSVPSSGAWAAVINMTDTETSAQASLLVSLGPDKQIAQVVVPNDMKGGWIVPRRATTQEIDAALRTATTLAQLKVAQNKGSTSYLLAGMGVLPLLLLASVLRRRRQNDN